MEARLFDEGTIPEFTTNDFFAGHAWIPPEAQRGHQERQAMVGELVVSLPPVETISDLGAGDGALVELLGLLTGAKVWGYDLGEANRRHAAETGRDVRYGDIVTGLTELDLGAIVTCTEVVEHLRDPHGWLRQLRDASAGRTVVLSSPSTETEQEHYEHHAWAWDLDGYADLVRGAGFSVMEQRECAAGFQAIAAS